MTYKKWDEDNPLKELDLDLLNRDGFVKQIIPHLLEKRNDAFVISLEGKWGYGKTSLINFIKHELIKNQNSETIVIDFNPWMIDSHKELIENFLFQLSDSVLKSDYTSQAKVAANNISKYATNFADIFSKTCSIIKFLPGAEPWASLIKEILQKLKIASSNIESLTNTKVLGLEEQKNNISNDLNNLDKNIIIFIDNMDRLLPDEVFIMLKIIKAIADFPRITFVLGVDYAYMLDSLKKLNIAKSDTYLDKVINIRIPLPQISQADIDTIFLTKLYQIVEYDTLPFGEVQERDQLLYSKFNSFMKTPRDIKRILNNLCFIWPTIKNEVSLTDILALLVIKNKFPQLYQHIFINSNRYGLTDKFFVLYTKPTSIEVDNLLKEFKQILDTYSITEKEQLQDLCIYLFPILTNDKDKIDSTEKYKSKGRVAAFSVLEVFFKHIVDNNNISVNDIKQILRSNGDERWDILKKNLFKHDEFFKNLHYMLKEEKVFDIKDFCLKFSALYYVDEIKQEFTKHEPAKNLIGFYLGGVISLIRRVVLDVLDSEKDYAVRYDTIKAVMKEHVFYMGTAIFANLLAQRGMFFSDGGVQEEDQWINDNDIVDIQLLWLDSVLAFIQDNNLFLDEFPYSSFLYLVGFHVKQDVFRLKALEIQSCFEKLLKGSEEDFNKLMACFFTTGTGSSTKKGSYVSVDMEKLSCLGDIDFIKKRVVELLKTTKLSNALRAVYLSIVNEKEYFLIDATENC